MADRVIAIIQPSPFGRSLPSAIFLSYIRLYFPFALVTDKNAVTPGNCKLGIACCSSTTMCYIS
jgi:hypothetical protein